MKKRCGFFLVLIVCLCIFSGCCLKHQWREADCITPKTCLECGKTDGEALGHSWMNASCLAPKTCRVCQKTEGETGSHDWIDANCMMPQTCSVCGFSLGETADHCWLDETCETPYTCSVCGETRGEPMGHYWLPANCVSPETCYYCGETRGTVSDAHLWNLPTTESPWICNLCGQTKGDRIITDPRFSTEKTECVYGTWKAKITIPLQQLQKNYLLWLWPDSVTSQAELPCVMYLLLYYDGNMELVIVPEALQVIQKETGNIGIRLDILSIYMGVYYAEEETLYLGLTWDDEMVPMEITLVDDDTWTAQGDLLLLTRDESKRMGFHMNPPGSFFSGINPDMDFGILTFERVDAREYDEL